MGTTSTSPSQFFMSNSQIATCKWCKCPIFWFRFTEAMKYSSTVNSNSLTDWLQHLSFFEIESWIFLHFYQTWQLTGVAQSAYNSDLQEILNNMLYKWIFWRQHF
jgi:hypothetical protein